MQIDVLDLLLGLFKIMYFIFSLIFKINEAYKYTSSNDNSINKNIQINSDDIWNAVLNTTNHYKSEYGLIMDDAIEQMHLIRSEEPELLSRILTKYSQIFN